MAKKTGKYKIDLKKFLALRAERHWTQQELSDKTGESAKSGEQAIPVREISRIETASVEPQMKTIERLARAFGMNTDALLVQVHATNKKNKHKINFQKIECSLRRNLVKQAKSGLSEKLHERVPNDYQPLAMEAGLVKTSIGAIDIAPRVSEEQQRLDYQNRSWENFDPVELLNPQSIYILSSDTGTGKTTFLRDLQIKLLKQTKLIPIFLHASELENLKFHDSNSFINCISTILGNRFSGAQLQNFLNENFQDIVLLVDGLDQIESPGKGYATLLDNLLKISPKRLIIASRPFAVISHEKDPSIKFLRLRSFDIIAQKAYFGKNYTRSLELCSSCPEMMTIPMLAYMIRLLIEEGKDNKIKNRAGLYKNFIDYILIEYKHDNLKATEDVETGVRQVLGEISYQALANQNPFVQKMPLAFARQYAEEYDIKIDEILKFGLTSLIINRSEGIDKFLYFGHQSFQEYLAAEYISQNNDNILQVLTEKWNLKWKDVIKFLVGFKGQEIIEKIFSEKDNPIHSKLFLAAELVSEANISSELRNQIWQKLKILFDNPLFAEDAEIYLLGANVDNKYTIDRLVAMLDNRDEHIRRLAKETIGTLNNKITIDIINKIASKLDSQNAYTRKSAIYALGKLGSNIPFAIINKIVNKFDDKNSDVRVAAITVLENLKDKADIKIVEKVVEKLDDKNPYVRSATIRTINELKNDIGINIVNKIASKLNSKDAHTQESAIDALGRLGSKIPIAIVNKIASKLDDKNPAVCAAAITNLGGFENKIDTNIFNEIAAKLDDKNPDVRAAAANNIGEFQDKINHKIINKIIDKLDDNNEDVRDSAIDTLEELQDKIDIKALDKIVNKLDDKNANICEAAIYTFGSLKNKADIKIVNKIAEKLDDKSPGVRRAAIWTLGELYNNVNIKIADKIVEKLDPNDGDICCVVTSALGKLHNKISYKITNKIIDAIDTNNSYSLCFLTICLGAMQNKINTKGINTITQKLDNENANIRHAAINILGDLKDKADVKIVNKIAEKLDDNTDYVRNAAINALERMKYKVDKNIIKKILYTMTYSKTSKNTNNADSGRAFNKKSYNLLTWLYQNGKLEFLTET